MQISNYQIRLHRDRLRAVIVVITIFVGICVGGWLFGKVILWATDFPISTEYVSYNVAVMLLGWTYGILFGVFAGLIGLVLWFLVDIERAEQ